jgi:hypothetical protein
MAAMARFNERLLLVGGGPPGPDGLVKAAPPGSVLAANKKIRSATVLLSVPRMVFSLW